MTTTRSKTSPNASNSTPNSASPSKTKGKRPAESSTSPTPTKRGKTEAAREPGQKTLEEIYDVHVKDGDAVEETGEGLANGSVDGEEKNGETKTDVAEGGGKVQTGDVTENEGPEKEGATAEAKDTVKTERDSGASSGENAHNGMDGVDVKDFAPRGKTPEYLKEEKHEETIVDEEDEEAVHSSILEKGIIYFFFRGRVNVEHPHGVEDVARSYIVLRPLPLDGKLDDGPLPDDGNARLLVLPKKVLPKSKKDRFLVFVENSKATIKDLKEKFLVSSDYATKTVGTSHKPAATPIAEGVYAITSTGRESHLAYIITVPKLGEIQEDLGLREKGSYVVSAKNPKFPAPGNAPSKMADYPEEILEEFRGLRWMPLKPELLDYADTQFLIIGEGMGDIESATKEIGKDEGNGDKEALVEEMERLEDEDQIRVEHLKSDDAIFADLGLSSKEYPMTQTTW